MGRSNWLDQRIVNAAQKTPNAKSRISLQPHHNPQVAYGSKYTLLIGKSFNLDGSPSISLIWFHLQLWRNVTLRLARWLVAYYITAALNGLLSCSHIRATQSLHYAKEKHATCMNLHESWLSLHFNKYAQPMAHTRKILPKWKSVHLVDTCLEITFNTCKKMYLLHNNRHFAGAQNFFKTSPGAVNGRAATVAILLRYPSFLLGSNLPVLSTSLCIH